MNKPVFIALLVCAIIGTCTAYPQPDVDEQLLSEIQETFKDLNEVNIQGDDDDLDTDEMLAELQTLLAMEQDDDDDNEVEMQEDDNDDLDTDEMLTELQTVLAMEQDDDDDDNEVEMQEDDNDDLDTDEMLAELQTVLAMEQDDDDEVETQDDGVSAQWSGRVRRFFKKKMNALKRSRILKALRKRRMLIALKNRLRNGFRPRLIACRKIIPYARRCYTMVRKTRKPMTGACLNTVKKYAHCRYNLKLG